MNIESLKTEFRRSIITNLNIISYENFPRVSEKILSIIGNIQENHVEYYNIYIDILFKKSTNRVEDLFIDLYTELCNKTFKYILSIDKEYFIIFYRTMINKCQSIFQEEITSDNKEEVLGCTILIANFINKSIIKKELLEKIILLLLDDGRDEKINLLITLLTTLDKSITLNSQIVTKIKEMSERTFKCTRINILLEDIVDKYK